MVKKNENSIWRILGAALFGFLLGSFIRLVVNFTTPNILTKINNISMKDAQILASSLFLSNIITGALIVFATSAIAGFLAKRKGVLVGLLSNILPIGFWVLAFAYALILRADPIQLLFSLPFLQFLVIILSSIFGGLYGVRFYSRDRDLDLDKHSFTIFGVCWYHYLWITPVVFYPFVSATIAIIYSWLYTFSTDLYFLINLGLWTNIAWWFYFFINPLIILTSGVAIVIAFRKFWQIMQCQQTYYTKWEKVGKVLLYGMVTPIIIKLIATFTINSTKNMFEPVVNDWKVEWFYILIIPVSGLIIKAGWWSKNKITSNQIKSK